jgi:transposase
MNLNVTKVHFNTKIKGLVGQDIQHTIEDVYVAYSNKFDQINKKLNFKIQNKLIISFYKKGGLKNFELTKKSTPLTKVMSYIAKYGSDNMIPYLSEKVKIELDLDKKQFFLDIINYCNKFGIDRLIKLGESKKDRLIKQYNKKPIEFKSLSYRSLSRVKDNIISINKNYFSNIKHFINIGGFVRETYELSSKRTLTDKMSIPIKYSKTHHGKIKDYCKDNVSYTVCLENKRVRIILTKPGYRVIETDGKEVLGVDVNVKHNLFMTSLGGEFDYDRKLFSGYVNFLKHLDKKKSLKIETSKISRQDQRDLNRWNLKMDNNMKENVNKLINYALLNNKNHLSIEDLELFGKMFTRSEEFEGFKYSRLCRMLNLSNLKHIIKSVAYKNGISVSFVQANYSSKQCSKCGCIHDNNRKTQEIFACVNCNYTINADRNSADNLENRVTSDVLREMLLKSNKEGENEPKILSKFKIKHILLQHSCKVLI